MAPGKVYLVRVWEREGAGCSFSALHDEWQGDKRRVDNAEKRAGKSRETTEYYAAKR